MTRMLLRRGCAALLLLCAMAGSAPAQSPGGSISTPPSGADVVAALGFTPAGLVANSFTGTQTFAPGAGATAQVMTAPAGVGSFLMQSTNVSAVDPLATLWQYGIGFFPNANLPDTTPNDVMSMGWNVVAGGGRLDPTKPATRFAMERYYTPDGNAAHAGSEIHLEAITTAGVTQRVFSAQSYHDGSFTSVGVIGTQFVLTDLAGVVPFQFNLTNKNLSVSNSATIAFNVNNTATVQQRNAAGNALLNLPYYVTDSGSDDRLNLGGAFRAIGTTPTTGSFANVFAYLQATALAANGVFLNGQLPTVAGSATAFQFVGSVSGSLTGIISNTKTSFSNAAAVLQLSTSATAGGDTYTKHSFGGTDVYVGTNRSSGNWSVSFGDTPGNADKLTVSTTGNLVASGSLKGGTPSGGTAAAWKPGVLVTSTTCTAETTKYVQLDVGGTAIKVATCQ
jgi:hypothetical protein